VDIGAKYKTAAIYTNHTLAIRANGTLWAWGDNYAGVNGGISSNVPVQLGTASNWEKVSTGWTHSMAINSLGQLFSWGTGTSGQLGQGTSGTTSAIGVTQITNPILSSGETWVEVSCGDQHTMALTSKGRLYVFGNNAQGQLGTSNNTNVNIPTCINCGTSDQMIDKISAGNNHSAYIDNNGFLFTTGLNSDGQLGDGTLVDKNIFIKIGTQTWINVFAGSGQTHAIGSLTTLYAWGLNSNTYGWLTVSDSKAPTYNGIFDFLSISTSGSHTLFLNNDNSLSSCGYYSNGARGDGKLGDSAKMGIIGLPCNGPDTSSCDVLYDNFNTNSRGNWVDPVLPSTHSVGWNVPIYGQHLVLKGLLSNNFQFIYQTNLNIDNSKFKATFDVRNARNAVLLSLNSRINPFFSDVVSSTGGVPATTTALVLTNAVLDGIAVTVETDSINGELKQFYKLYAKDSGVITTAPNVIAFRNGLATKHYLELERKNSTTLVLNVYLDDAHSLLFGTTGDFTIPASIIGLNTSVISSMEWYPYGKSGLGDLDNICISNSQNTSIKKISKSAFQIYPNPASNQLSIISKNTIQQVVIYDMQGKELAIINKDYQTIDISQFNNGLYFVVVKTNLGIESGKLIIQK